MENVIKALETYGAGRVMRGLLWVFAWMSAQGGIEAPPDAVAVSIGKWAAAAILFGVAVGWSFVKDKIWKAEPPK